MNQFEQLEDMAEYVYAKQGIDLDKLTKTEKQYLMLELLDTLEELEKNGLTKGLGSKMTESGRIALLNLRRTYPQLAERIGRTRELISE